MRVVENAKKSVQILPPYPDNRTVSLSSSASFSCHIRTDSSSPPNVQVSRIFLFIIYLSYSHARST